MSVYRKGRFWHYDFQYQGRRFHGSTGQESKRAAEAVERKRRYEAASGTYADAGEMTLESAANRYWEEVASTKRAARNTERQLRVMMACVGPALKLREIDAPEVVTAIARRRGMKVGKRLPSNTTVNRDIIDATLRPLLNRARKVWKARQMPEIEWRELRLPEPKAQSREYSDAQVQAWKGQLDPVPRFALHILLTYGVRFGELIFRPEALIADRCQLIIEGKYRKNEETLTLALTQEDTRILAAMAGRAQALGFASVLHHGDPPTCLTYGKLYYALRKGAERSGINMPRMIHGTRHHAATRLLRHTENLKKVQKALGHASILSTARYANVSDADLRADFEALSRNSPETESGTPDNAMISKGKSDAQS